MKLLVEQRGDVSTRGAEKGETALYQASLTRDDGSPLHLVCLDGSLTAVKMLVAAGADVDRCHQEAGTAVHAACSRLAPGWTAWAEEDRCTRGISLRECEGRADFNRPGGVLGFALSAACHTIGTKVGGLSALSLAGSKKKKK